MLSVIKTALYCYYLQNYSFFYRKLSFYTEKSNRPRLIMLPNFIKEYIIHLPDKARGLTSTNCQLRTGFISLETL